MDVLDKLIGIGIDKGEDALKKKARNLLEGGPEDGDLIVVVDGKSPEPAVRCLARYLSAEAGRTAYIMSAKKYQKEEKKYLSHQIIIVGHNDLAKRELKRVSMEFDEWGMKYGKSGWQYVLRAKKKELGSKKAFKAFASYYEEQISGGRYRELARTYGVPARFPDNPREGQYNLLWMEFVLREFPPQGGQKREQGEPKEEKPPPAEPSPERGIVFCGGGAKGAFELGVWKWLEEQGLADQFTGVSGASVGALNTLLFVQQDYAKAERVWLSMEEGDLDRPNPQLRQNILELWPEDTSALEALGALAGNWKENAGLFSKEKLLGLVRANLSLTALENKQAYVSLTVLGREKGEPFLYSKYARLDSRDGEEAVVQKVMASAALPGAYVPERVDGDICVDGGVLDNAPAYPLVKAGFREIVVVHLSVRNKDGQDGLLEFNQDLYAKLTPGELEGVRFYHVWPDASLKNLLNISPELTRWRVQAGYEAARAQLAGLSDRRTQ